MKIIPRDLPTVDAITGCDEFLLGLEVMYQNEIGVVACGRLERLPRSLGQNMHGYAGLFGKGGEDVREQARIFD